MPGGGKSQAGRGGDFSGPGPGNREAVEVQQSFHDKKELTILSISYMS